MATSGINITYATYVILLKFVNVVWKCRGRILQEASVVKHGALVTANNFSYLMNNVATYVSEMFHQP